ncbi:MAG: diguanylate cyclase [Candidatus Omnitrophica bacterium]|nr:diguanylate cyclase [Candidatus Omnitrophota bacterium]
MIRFPIGQKIFYGFSIIILLSLAALYVSFPYLNKINALSSQILPLEREVNFSHKYSEAVRFLESKIELYLVIGSQEAKENALSSLGQLEQITKEIAQDQSLMRLQGLVILARKLSSTTSILFDAIAKKEPAQKINSCILDTVVNTQAFEVNQKYLQSQNLENTLRIAVEEKMIVSTLLNTFVYLGLAIILIGFIIGFLLTSVIVRNLLKLQRVTKDIAAGNFDSRVDVQSKDEIGELADSFNLMLMELKKSTVSNDYLESLINSMADMLVVVDVHLTILRVNRAVCGLLGYEEDELLGSPLTKLFSPTQTLFNNQDFREHIKKGGLIDYEMHYRTKDDIDIPVLFSASIMKDKDKNVSFIICTAQDITILKKAEQELRALSLKDALTGLYNRRGLLALGEQQIRFARRNKEDVMLLFLDMDNMKWINDTFGHAEGDKALIDVAKVMKKTFRDPDIIARIGGDEFVVIAVQAAKHEENTLINRLKSNLDARNKEEGHCCPLSLSIGVAICEALYIGSVDEFIKQADEMMYQDKKKKS